MSKGHSSRGQSKYAPYGRSSAQNQNVVHVNANDERTSVFERLGHRRESNTPYGQDKDIKTGPGNKIIDIGEKHRDRDRDSSRSSKRHSKSLVSPPSKNQLGSSTSAAAAGHNREKDKDKDFINRIVEKTKKHLSSRRNSENNSKEGGGHQEKSGRGRGEKKVKKGKGNSSISSTSSSSSGESSSSTTSSSDSDDSSVPSIYKDKPNKKKRKNVLATSESKRTKIKPSPSSSSTTTPPTTKTDKSNPVENKNRLKSLPKKEQYQKKGSDSFHNSQPQQYQYQHQQQQKIDSYGVSTSSGFKRDTKDINEKDYNRKRKLVDDTYNSGDNIKKPRNNNMDEYNPSSSQMKYKTAPPRRSPSPHQRRTSAEYPNIVGGNKYDSRQASKRDFPSNSNNYDERYNNPNLSRIPPPRGSGGDRDRSYANSNLYSFSQTSNAQPSVQAQSSPRKHLLEQHHRGSIPIDGINSKNRGNNLISTSTTGQNRSGIDSKVKKVDSKIKPLMEEEFPLDGKNLNKYKTQTQLVDQKRVTAPTSQKRKLSPLIVKTKEELMERYEELNKKSRVDLWVDQTIKGSDIEPPEIAKISTSSPLNIGIDDFKVKEKSSSAGSREKIKVDDLEEISDDDDDGILEKELDDDNDEGKIDESKLLQIPIETERISADELEIKEDTPTPTPTLKSFVQQNKTEGSVSIARTASVGDSRDLRSVQSQSQTDDDILERMNESFESISDDDDIINDQQKFGIIDTLGVDWASLVCREKSADTIGSITSNNIVKASLKERWNPLELIKQVGISKELCGEELFQNVVHKISELNQMKRTSSTVNNPVIVVNDTNKDTSGLTDDTNNDSTAGSSDDTANVTSKTNTEGVQEGNVSSNSITDDNKELDKVVQNEDSNNKIEELSSLSLEEIEKELERPILRKRRLEGKNMLRNFGIYSKILYARKDVFIKKYNLNAGKLVVPVPTPTQETDIVDMTSSKPNLPRTNGEENLNNVKT